MALSEKLYELRKKRGPSQEQLAEQLSVSRQAISKWESGKAVPESDTLISISKYYDVTLDYLMKENDVSAVAIANSEQSKLIIKKGREKQIFGLVTCILGVVCLLAWGIISIISPSASDRIGTSSMITVDGNGIFLIICVIVIVVGAVLLLKNSSDK